MNEQTKKAMAYECVFISSVDSRYCYQCGKTRAEHDGKRNLFTLRLSADMKSTLGVGASNPKQMEETLA